MKTNEELNALRNEVEALNKKLAELSKEELELVTSGIANGRAYWNGRRRDDKGNDSGNEEQPNAD